jgi:2'-5' RNA ligase
MLTFDRLDFWNQPKVVCLTCQEPAPQVVMLAAALNSAVAGRGLPIDSRPYVPHITLSRHARSLPAIVFEPIVWRAESFCLVESCRDQAGVCYKVRQQWPFIEPAV